MSINRVLLIFKIFRTAILAYRSSENHRREQLNGLAAGKKEGAGWLINHTG
jgi:hypothetical protein